MGKYVIKGGNKLNGEIIVGGAKNSVLPIIASTVLNKGITILKNVPMLLDTMVAIDILRHLGATIDIGKNTLVINTKTIYKTCVDEELSNKMRSSVIFLGSLLSRFREGTIYLPGGCNLGSRPIDFHLNAFEKMNMKVDYPKDYNCIKIDAKNSKPTDITLPLASVGATQNIILASVLTKGTTVIKNSAKEPEIVDLVSFLREMGACIDGEGTDTIKVTGVEHLKNVVEYTIMPDRIEAGTFLFMGALCGGDIKVNNICSMHLQSTLYILEKMGVDLLVNNNEIHLKSSKRLNPVEYVETNPYPNFPTDLQPQLVTSLLLSRGTSVVKENMFEARNIYINELVKLGANVDGDNKTFIVTGVDGLHGTKLFAKDLRGGASLIQAGLVACGETIVENAKYIKRGYEKIDKKLSLLGADIKYVKS